VPEYVQLNTLLWAICKSPAMANLNPLQRPTHSDPIINKHTEQVKKPRMDLSWYTLTSCYRLYLSNTLKSKDLATLTFKKNSRNTHKNQLKSNPVSERSAYPLQNYICWVRKFWPQIYSL